MQLGNSTSHEALGTFLQGGHTVTGSSNIKSSYIESNLSHKGKKNVSVFIKRTVLGLSHVSIFTGLLIQSLI